MDDHNSSTLPDDPNEQAEVNGNVAKTKEPYKFKRTSQLFAHRKDGAQKRFARVWIDLKEQVQTAWLTDLEEREKELSTLFKSNQALTGIKRKRLNDMAAQTAKATLQTVFDEWRIEINRILVDLRGYPQEDGNVLFPDGSQARIPKTLFIPLEHHIKF